MPQGFECCLATGPANGPDVLPCTSCNRKFHASCLGVASGKADHKCPSCARSQLRAKTVQRGTSTVTSAGRRSLSPTVTRGSLKEKEIQMARRDAEREIATARFEVERKMLPIKEDSVRRMSLLQDEPRRRGTTYYAGKGRETAAALDHRPNSALDEISFADNADERHPRQAGHAVTFQASGELRRIIQEMSTDGAQATTRLAVSQPEATARSTRDATTLIGESSLLVMEQLVTDSEALRIKRQDRRREAVAYPELPKFDGSPQDWPRFITSLIESTQEYGISQSENVARLQQALQGEAESLVRGFLGSGAGVPLVVRYLRRQFGSSVAVLQSMEDACREMADVGNDLRDLLPFMAKVEQLCLTIRLYGETPRLRNPGLVAALLNKLPPHAKLVFACSGRVAEQTDLEGLLDWLDSIAGAVPAFEDTAATRPTHTVMTVSAAAVARPAPSTTVARPKTCPAGCEARHGLQQCEQFARMNPQQRLWLTLRLRICWSCLTSHRRVCQAIVRCHCGATHHPLLHDAWTTEGQTQGPAAADASEQPRQNVKEVKRSCESRILALEKKKQRNQDRTQGIERGLQNLAEKYAQTDSAIPIKEEDSNLQSLPAKSQTCYLNTSEVEMRTELQELRDQLAQIRLEFSEKRIELDMALAEIRELEAKHAKKEVDQVSPPQIPAECTNNPTASTAQLFGSPQSAAAATPDRVACDYDSRVPVEKERFIPSKACICFPEVAQVKPDTSSMTPNVDAADAALEKQPNRETPDQTQVTSTETRLQHMEEKIQELELERDRQNKEIHESQLKYAKMLKKLKEYEAANENSSRQKSMDHAIQEELREKVRTLETRLCEDQERREKEQLEKESLRQRLAQLTADHAKMTESWATQELELERHRTEVQHLRSKLLKMSDTQHESEPEGAYEASCRESVRGCRTEGREAGVGAERVGVDEQANQRIAGDQGQPAATAREAAGEDRREREAALAAGRTDRKKRRVSGASAAEQERAGGRGCDERTGGTSAEFGSRDGQQDPELCANAGEAEAGSTRCARGRKGQSEGQPGAANVGTGGAAEASPEAAAISRPIDYRKSKDQEGVDVN